MGDSGGWVAERLIRLAARAVGMRPRPAMLNPTLRAALLVDLALRGALTDADDHVEMDTTPTGFAPADRLLACVLDRPDQPMVRWLYHAPVTVVDVLDVLVKEGSWGRRGPLRHYRDLRPELASADMTSVRDASRGRACAPATAAVALLLPLLPPRVEDDGVPAEKLVDQCGASAWIIGDLLDELNRQRMILDNASTQTQFTVAIQDIG